jgi:hypothetical protein
MASVAHYAISTVSGPENSAEPYHSFSGLNARQSWAWIVAELQRHYPHVPSPFTKAAHEEFPEDWSDFSAVPDGWPRTIKVARGGKSRASGAGTGHPDALRPVLIAGKAVIQASSKTAGPAAKGSG